MTTPLARAEALFEAHRAYLHAIAYRMLGSFSDADDVLQDACLRLARAELASFVPMEAISEDGRVDLGTHRPPAQLRGYTLCFEDDVVRAVGRIGPGPVGVGAEIDADLLRGPG